MRQLADALATLQPTGPDARAHEAVPGCGPWVRAFTTTLRPAAPPPAAATEGWVEAAPQTIPSRAR